MVERCFYRFLSCYKIFYSLCVDFMTLWEVCELLRIFILLIYKIDRISNDQSLFKSNTFMIIL